MKYKTEWIEYPDIEEHCKRIGAPPTEKKPDGRDHYTLPVIYDPNTKTVVADTETIAKYLEKTYPGTPRLFPEGTHAFQAAFSQFLVPTTVATFYIIVDRICSLLNPRSVEYFRRTREEAFGKKLEELASEGDWKKLESELDSLKKCLDANGEGKDLLLMGDKITWADIEIASWLRWMKMVVGEESEDWKRLTTLHGGRWAKIGEQFARYEYIDLP